MYGQLKDPSTIRNTYFHREILIHWRFITLLSVIILTFTMASGISFDQPRFNWDTSDEFQEFQRFKQHVEFTYKGPLAKTDKKDRCGWLGMWIGQQGREIYKTFNFDAGQEDDPANILKKLEDYVRPHKNKRVARYKLHRRKQLEGESFDNFVKDLRILLMDCDYTDIDDILIDLIISGVRHPKVQERLLDKGDTLNLNQAIEIGRQYELSQSQLKLIRGEEVLLVKSQKKFSTKKKKFQFGAKNTVQSSWKGTEPRAVMLKDNCGSCGISHVKGKCPAKGTVCKYCHKPDHWLKVCRKRLRKVNIIEEEDSNVSDEEIIHIKATDTVEQIDSVHEDKWIASLSVTGKNFKFRIDTGAKCCIMVKSDFEKLDNHLGLQKSSKTQVIQQSQD